MTRALRYVGIVMVLAGILGAGIIAPSAGAIIQNFGTIQGNNWVIGSYYRDGTNAAVPNPSFAAGGALVVYSQISNSGNISRLAVGYLSGPCARVLGNGAGFTWGDSYCYAV
jgi:hypothetical protein